MTPVSSSFLFCTCQIGAEAALKQEMARSLPDSRFSFSRPGFVTFKLEGEPLPVDALPAPVFARRTALSLEQVRGDTPAELAAGLRRACERFPAEHLHIFGRDEAEAGRRLPDHPHGYQPGLTEQDRQARQNVSADFQEPSKSEDRFGTARPDRLVLDCVRVEPGQWWLGIHRAVDPATRWPGGFWPGNIPDEAVSRAYGKLAEALDWSRLPLREGDWVADIGCAPGGTSQALLDRKMQVLGIDPAEIAPAVAARSGFIHLRKRGAEVRIRDLAHVRWLVADMNVAPEYTLSTLERIATHPEITLRGVVMNLKLLEWKLAREIPDYLERVRRWGFDLVPARQLSHNRQEICIVGTRRSVLKRRRRIAGKFPTRPSSEIQAE